MQHAGLADVEIAVAAPDRLAAERGVVEGDLELLIEAAGLLEHRTQELERMIDGMRADPFRFRFAKRQNFGRVDPCNFPFRPVAQEIEKHLHLAPIENEGGWSGFGLLAGQP